MPERIAYHHATIGKNRYGAVDADLVDLILIVVISASFGTWLYHASVVQFALFLTHEII